MPSESWQKTVSGSKLELQLGTMLDEPGIAEEELPLSEISLLLDELQLGTMLDEPSIAEEELPLSEISLLLETATSKWEELLSEQELLDRLPISDDDDGWLPPPSSSLDEQEKVNAKASRTPAANANFETVSLIKKLLSLVPVHLAKPFGKNQGLAGSHHHGVNSLYSLLAFS